MTDNTSNETSITDRRTEATKGVLCYRHSCMDVLCVVSEERSLSFTHSHSDGKVLPRPSTTTLVSVFAARPLRWELVPFGLQNLYYFISPICMNKIITSVVAIMFLKSY